MELLNRIRKAMVRTGHAGKKATAIFFFFVFFFFFF